MRSIPNIFSLLAIFATLGQARSDDLNKRIDDFISIATSSQGRALLRDEAAISEALSISSGEGYRGLLERLLSSDDRMEYLVLNEAWKRLAKRNRHASSVASASIFLESNAPQVVDAMSRIMKGSDEPRRGERWSFSSYKPVLEAVGWQGSERLLFYIFNHSPAAGIEVTMEVFGGNISATSRSEILDSAWRYEEGLREPHERLVGEAKLTEFATFSVSLLNEDPILFSPYIGAVLRRERIRNALPDLREKLESTSVLGESFFVDEITPSGFPPIQSNSLDSLVFASSENLPSAEIDNNGKALEIDGENLDFETRDKDSAPGVSLLFSMLIYLALGGAIVVALLLLVRGFWRSRDIAKK